MNIKSIRASFVCWQVHTMTCVKVQEKCVGAVSVIIIISTQCTTAFTQYHAWYNNYMLNIVIGVGSFGPRYNSSNVGAISSIQAEYEP